MHNTSSENSLHGLYELELELHLYYTDIVVQDRLSKILIYFPPHIGKTCTYASSSTHFNIENTRNSTSFHDRFFSLMLLFFCFLLLAQVGTVASDKL